MEQERERGRIQRVEHFRAEVVDHVPVVAGEAGDEGHRVRPVTQSQRGQLQPGRPPFGAALQPADILRTEVQMQQIVEQQVALLRREPKVVGPQLQQLAAHPQPGQRQRRVRPGRDHQAQGGGQPLDEHADAPVDLGISDHVVVVEDQQQLGVERGHIVDEHRNEVTFDVGRRRAQQRQRRLSHLGDHGPQRGEQVAPKPQRVVVRAVERHPAGPRRLAGNQPVGEQGRLAPTGRGVDEGEPGHCTGAEQFVQPRPRHQGAAPPGQEQLRPQQRFRSGHDRPNRPSPRTHRCQDATHSRPRWVKAVITRSFGPGPGAPRRRWVSAG